MDKPKTFEYSNSRNSGTPTRRPLHTFADISMELVSLFAHVCASVVLVKVVFGFGHVFEWAAMGGLYAMLVIEHRISRFRFYESTTIRATEDGKVDVDIET